MKATTKLIFALLVLAPILLYFWNFHFGWSMMQSDWGTFGDYLGGVLGTLLSGLTIYFVYTTYQTQNSQLKIQKREAYIKDIDLQYDRIISSINEISFRGKKGVDALLAWDDTHENSNKGSNVVNMLNLIIHAFNDHVVTIFEGNDVTNKEKTSLYDRAYLMLHAMLIWPVLEKIYDDKVFPRHTDNLKENFDKLMKEAYHYLVIRGKLKEPDDKRIVPLYKMNISPITTAILEQVKNRD